MLIVQLGDLGASDGGVAGQEDGTPGTPVVHYGYHAIKASAFGESGDEIHGDLCERGHVLGNCDLVKWGAGFVREVLILLADCAPLYVLLDPGSCSWPEIVAADLPCCLVSAPVPPSYVVVPFP